jgi:MFS transporter, ACS family, D-galactonate transporter
MTAELDKKQVPRRRWRIAWLLGLGVLINYFDRVNLSVSHNALIAAFGISDVTFGILSSAYNWTYALCQIPIGVVLDWLGVQRVGRVSTFVWSLASFGAAAAANVPSFFAARLVLGIGEAPTFPANAKATGHWFPQEERSFATSYFDAAAKFASAIGVPFIGILLLHIGWRLSFAATGLLSLLYFLLFFVVYREPEKDPRLTREEFALIRASGRQGEDQPQRQVSLWYLLGQRRVVGLALGFGSYNYVFYLLLVWLPTYLSESLHINLLDSFLYTGVPWLVATVTDLLIGGWLVDVLIQRGWNANRVRMVVLVGGTAMGLGILGGAHSHSATGALVWISCCIGGLSAAAPVGWSFPSLIAPRGSVGRVGGIMNFSNQVSGIAASIVTGILVQKWHNFAAAFGVAAAYLVVGISAYLFLLRNADPIEPEVAAG